MEMLCEAWNDEVYGVPPLFPCVSFYVIGIIF